jgi:hypothetical protein
MGLIIGPEVTNAITWVVIIAMGAILLSKIPNIDQLANAIIDRIGRLISKKKEDDDDEF